MQELIRGSYLRRSPMSLTRAHNLSRPRSLSQRPYRYRTPDPAPVGLPIPTTAVSDGFFRHGAGHTKVAASSQKVTRQGQVVAPLQFVVAPVVTGTSCFKTCDGFPRYPYGFHNLVVCADSRFPAARSYSLIKPPRIVRRLIPYN